MQVPIIPGRTRTSEAVPALLNPANHTQEDTETITDGAIFEVVPLINRQEVVIQVQTGAAIWIKWGGGTAAVNDGFKVPVGGVVTMAISHDKAIAIISETGDAQVYIGQFGGKYG